MKTVLSFLIIFVLMSVSALSEVTVSIPGAKKTEEQTYKLPFDGEYKIVLDNRDQRRRALVNIRIDGREATGKGLILREGERVELERYLDSGTLSKGNKFKFIPKEGSLRKSHPEDGNIIITVQYEVDTKPVVEYRQEEETYSTDLILYPWQEPKNWWWSDKYEVVSSIPTSGTNSLTSYSETAPGITVEGSESVQRFKEDKIGELGKRIDTLKIILQGFYKNPPILLRK